MIKFRGEKLTEIREEMKLSKSAFAALVKYPRQTIIRWENGTSSPQQPALDALVKATVKPLSFFFSDETIPPSLAVPKLGIVHKEEIVLFDDEAIPEEGLPMPLSEMKGRKLQSYLVKDDDLVPYFIDGETIIFDAESQDYEGNIVSVLYEGKMLVRKYEPASAGKVKLFSLRTDQAVTVTKDKIKVLGVFYAKHTPAALILKKLK